MKIKYLLLSLLLSLAIDGLRAQEKRSLSFQEAVEMALSKSDEAQLADTKVKTAAGKLQVTKNHQYPDFDISGQYKYLSGANVKLNFNPGIQDSDEEGTQAAETPDINQLLLGQANISVPVFSGFKIRNAIHASTYQYQAATFLAENDKEQLALQTIQDYINLYKSRKMLNLVKENLKSTQQRVKDFKNLEKNGLLARNDLLKSQLQEANVELLLEEAKKNERILNYKLARNLKLPEGTQIQTSDMDFGLVPSLQASQTISRSDLEALELQEKAAEDQVKIAKSGYYPSIGLSGGYMALDLKNALEVTNAMNIGVGISYNLANLFKLKSDVKVAKSKARELQHHIDIASDKIQVQIKKAEQDYQLTLRKLEVYTQSEDQAIENYRIVKDKYDNGLSDTNDLLEADVQQLQAKINLANSKADITQKYYELLTARGNLSSKFNQQ